MSTVVTGEEAVLMWSNERASCYGLKVTDFSSCWNDGRVVTAIIHSLFPKEFDFKSLTFTNTVSDMKIAFKCLEKHHKPDPKSVTLFAAELMKYSQGNYEGYDEEKFNEARKKRLEEEAKEEEEIKKKKQAAIDALAKCTECGQPISTYAYEFCGYPYHDTCIKCNGCGKPVRFKALAVDDKPYCELCGRNTFMKLKSDGWVPPEGVKGPISTRIGKFTDDMKAPPPKQTKPVEAPKKTEEKSVSKEPELISRTVVETTREGGFMIEKVEEIIFDPVLNKKKKRIIKRKIACKKEQKNDEDDELKRLEEEQRKLEEEMRREEEEEEAELKRLEEEMLKEEEEFRKQEEEIRRQEEELRKLEEDEEDDELQRIEEELKKLRDE
ncbi:Alpha-actinin [Entamoeba marina]